MYKKGQPTDGRKEQRKEDIDYRSRLYLRIKTDQWTRERYNENWLIELAGS